MTTVLIIDDSPEDREWLADLASKANATDVRSFEDVEDGLASFRERAADIVILDDWLGSKRGWAFAPSFQAISQKTSVIITSGVPFPNVEVLSEKLNVTFLVKEEMTEFVLRDLMPA